MCVRISVCFDLIVEILWIYLEKIIFLDKFPQVFYASKRVSVYVC